MASSNGQLAASGQQQKEKVVEDIVGWTASIILLATVVRQVVKQAQSESNAQGVSAWLFVGQAMAAALFVIYAILLDNWVFIVTNSVLLITALIGQWITWRQRHKSKPDPSRAQS